MASQAVTGSQESASQESAVLEFLSFIRGYHVYQTTWYPKLGDVLCLEREPTNCKDRYAVAVINGSIVVGHLPYNIHGLYRIFLKEV